LRHPAPRRRRRSVRHQVITKDRVSDSLEKSISRLHDRSRLSRRRRLSRYLQTDEPYSDHVDLVVSQDCVPHLSGVGNTAQRREAVNTTPVGGLVRTTTVAMMRPSKETARPDDFHAPRARGTKGRALSQPCLGLDGSQGPLEVRVAMGQARSLEGLRDVGADDTAHISRHQCSDRAA
jgi:hypothetical protein